MLAVPAATVGAVLEARGCVSPAVAGSTMASPAAPASPDSAAEIGSAAPADSAVTRANAATRDSAATPERARAGERRVVRLGPPDLSRFNRPRWVMLRSLVLPGWGQVHNHAWLKAGAVAGTQAWLITSLIHDKRTLDDLKREVDAAGAAGDDLLQQDLVDRYNTRLSSYQSRQWLLGGVVVFALLDAYIDAHFRNFKIEFESDPALPSGASTGGDLRIGVEWKY